MDGLGPLELGTAVTAMLLAYFVRGITGFGSALVAVPLMAHVLPLTVVVPAILVADLGASLVLGGMDRRQVAWRELAPLIPAGMTGAVAGVALLTALPTGWLLTALGLFVVAFGLRSLLVTPGTQPASRWWALPAGLVGGTVGSMFGTGGPPYVIYLSHRLRDKTALRATFSGLFMIDGGFRALLFASAGLFHDSRTFWLMALGLPAMLLGLRLGHRVHLSISNTQMMKGIGLLLLASGASVLLRAATG